MLFQMQVKSEQHNLT